MSLAKLEALTHHIVHERSGHPDGIGTNALHRTLWHADVQRFTREGAPITGVRYIRHAEGPRPEGIQTAIDNLVRSGAISIVAPDDPLRKRRYVSKQPPNPIGLDNEERAYAALAIELALDAPEKPYPRMLSKIWQTAGKGEPIPMHGTLAARPGKITTAVVRWAKNAMRMRKAPRPPQP